MPPKPKVPNKHRKTLIIVAAAGGLLLLLYLRSRSSSSTNASNPTDVQNAATQAADQQAQQDAALYGANTPSTFADNGANAAALGDAVTQGLGGVSDALTQLQDAINAPAPTTPPGASPSITVNVNGNPAARSQTGKVTTVGGHTRPPKPRLPKGVHLASYFGPHKPTAPKGMETIGLGHGYWGFRKKTK